MQSYLHILFLIFPVDDSNSHRERAVIIFLPKKNASDKFSNHLEAIQGLPAIKMSWTVN